MRRMTNSFLVTFSHTFFSIDENRYVTKEDMNDQERDTQKIFK